MKFAREREYVCHKWQRQRIKAFQPQWCSDDVSMYPGDKAWTELQDFVCALLNFHTALVQSWFPILLPFSAFQVRMLAPSHCILEVYNLMVDVIVTQSWEYALRWEEIWIRTFKQCWESLDSEPLQTELNAYDIMRWPWTFGNVVWACRVAQRLMCLTILFPACYTVLVGTLFPNLSSCVTYNFA